MRFRAVAEETAGPRWRAVFDELWPAYETWFLREGDRARPSYAESRRELNRHMPELVSTYDGLVELAGGSDRVARCLALYCPPPYLTGCSQAVWQRGEPVLVRNYDYSPALLDGVLLQTAWARRVTAVLDCLWGVLDGINDAGLAVSLAFGGRTVTGVGFGIPLVLRYVLETASDVTQATEILKRVPVHMAYNVTLVDAAGDFATVQVAPDRAPMVTRAPLATNHQGPVEWVEHARATATLERERFLQERLQDAGETAESLIERFAAPPLFSTAYARGWGTLYTAVYWPRRGVCELRWPHARWEHHVSRFEERELEMHYDGAPDSQG